MLRWCSPPLLFFSFPRPVSPISTLQHIVRCLRSLLYVRTLLPSTSPLRLSSASQLPHLLSMFLPTDAGLHEEASRLLFADGDVKRGLTHSMHDMALQLNRTLEFPPEEGLIPMHESWTAMLRYGALLLSAGLETHLTNMARRVLSNPIVAGATIEAIAFNCKVDLCGRQHPHDSSRGEVESITTSNTYENCSTSITYPTLARVFKQCMLQQNILPSLFKEDADSHRSSSRTTNEFGFNPFHHLTLFGDNDLVDQLLRLDSRSSPDVRQSMTHFGLSALHLAVMRGHKSMVRHLIDTIGVTQNWRDWKGRTALEIMCLHGFKWNLDIAKVLAPKMEIEPEAYCESIRYSSTKSPLAIRPGQVQPQSCIQSGGWSLPLVYSASILPDPYPCLAVISSTPRLSFVSHEEQLQHVLAQRTLRAASGITHQADDPIESGTLPKTPIAQLYSSTCDLPILRPPTSYSEFISEIVALQRPVLIKGALRWDHIEFSSTYHTMQRQQLIDQFGSIRVTVSNIPYGATFDRQVKEMTIKQFVDIMGDIDRKDREALKTKDMKQWTNITHFIDRPYVFLSIPLTSPAADASSTSPDPSHPSRLLPLFSSPSWLTPPPRSDADVDLSSLPSDTLPTLDPTTHTPLTLRTLQFFLGTRFSGAPEHFHRSAINMQWFGRKHWTIQPPHQAAYNKRNQIEEMADADAAAGAGSSSSGSSSSSRAAGALHCIQEAGDIVFVPDFWSHATINLEESIGFAAELLWGATHFSV